VYLDVWERPIGYIEDDHIREVALGGPDTSTRAQVVWQVKTEPLKGIADCKSMTDDQWMALKDGWQPTHRGLLQAQVAKQDASTDPCITAPKSSYRGAENQLYRVEIHRGGSVSHSPATDTPGPTFKWSRDNGSVCFPIRSLSGNTAEVETLGRDDRHSLQVNDWVEVVYDEVVLRNTWPSLSATPAIMAQVVMIERSTMLVTLAPRPNGAVIPTYPSPSPKPPESVVGVSHPFLRRWDYKARPKGSHAPSLADDGALALTEGEWLTLEDGVQIKFTPAPHPTPPALVNKYRSGDYWLIPARTATGDVEWPNQIGADGELVLEKGQPKPQALPPHGVDHHYAQLAVVTGGAPPVHDCRCRFKPVCAPPP
jgi:hypothetical protein